MIAEVAGTGTDTVVAYRVTDGDQRFVQSIEKARVAAPDRARLPLKKSGCYLITGGTGGIGLTVAEHLARHYQAKLILTSRQGRPGADDPRTRRLATIEALGAEIVVAKADVSDAAAMARVVAQESRAIGVQWNFFPVADVNSVPVNPIINTRAFGEIGRAHV